MNSVRKNDFRHGWGFLLDLKSHRKWLRYVVVAAVVFVAAALRVWPLHTLQSRAPWLTFYPAVVVAAVYGGFRMGLLSILLSCLTVFFLWNLLVAQPFIVDSADWLGMAVFFLNCAMISGVAEAMRRAQSRAEKAQEQAEGANRAKSVFLANMSHELRTPLNAILGFSELLRNDAGIPAEQRKTLTIINRSGEHLLTLINDVLDMAKIEAGGGRVENAPLDLQEVVRDVLELMRVRAGEKNLQLALDQSSSFPRIIRGDAAKLRQVLINLVGNAVKYTEEGGVTVRLSAAPSDDPHRLLLAIEVEDTGIGIAEEDRVRIFDPFVQIEKQALQKGTGLGLAITREYVGRMGGTIGVESAPGKGSTFRVEIPVEQAGESELRGIRIPRGRIVGLEPGQPECRVLIVEDQMENWLLLRRLLEDAGFAVRVAEDGAAGVEAFREWRPRFLWMDVRMPVMDGLEATRRIRAMEGGGDVKIAGLTASVFEEERSNVLAAGMDDFVRKPYRPEEIFDCMKRHLGVRLLVEETPGPGEPERTAGLLHPEAFAGVPAPLRGELADALIGLDAARISGAVRKITDTDPALGSALSHRVERLEYTSILRALGAFGKEPPKENA